MLKDITIGQFYSGNSFIHKMDARAKIFAEIFIAVLIFLSKNFYGIGLLAALTLFFYILSGLSLRLIFKSMKPILPIIIITAVLNIFYTKGENLLFKWRFIKIYEEALYKAGYLGIRIVVLITVMSLLTYTTSPMELTDAIEKLLTPLKKIRFPAHELAMMMTIALRFIPTLIEETDKIMSAQKARGANLDTGSIIKRAKALIPVLIPLFISSFRRANELALAMECRCYRGGEGRTRLKVMRFSWRDPIAALFLAAFCVGILFLNFYFSSVI